MRFGRLVRRGRGEGGQILPLFALTVVALFGMAALLFDAAQALVVRRQLQDATDAAALAAANVVQAGVPAGCSATAGPPPGAPRASVDTAARTSLTANVGATLSAAAVVTCADGWGNGAVRVQLTQNAPLFFARILGRSAFTVSARSTAINTYSAAHGYSVITLNPHNPSWPPNLQGCPSFLFNGAPTVESYGSIHVDSACLSGSGYAMSRNGVASTITLYNNSFIEVVGEADPGAMTIVPPPIQGAQYIPDPLAAVPAPNVPVPCPSTTVGSLCGVYTVRSGSQLTLNGQANSRVLDPGVYIGGIRLTSSARAYFRPGIYIFQGGGLDLGSQAKIFTVPVGHSSTTDIASQAAWAGICPNDGSCGVMFYNMTNSSGSMGPFLMNAGGTFYVRGYQRGYTGQGANPDYKGLLIWQARTPAPTSSYIQPMVRLRGGASVQISGTIYAPAARVEMAGGSGGGGGFDIDYFLQFIVWDITFSGTSNWRLQYSDIYFFQPPDYGLIE